MGIQRRVTAFLSILSALTITLTLAGCGLLGGEETPAAQGDQQRQRVKVAILPTMDVVPLQLAIDAGYFAEEGLEVETVTAASGADCVTKLAAGEVQFAFSSFTPFFVAKAKNAADVRLVADATSAAPGYAVVVTMPNSPIASINDLAGKRVAITARFTISHLLVQAQLKAAGMDPDGVQWVELPFPQMPAQLSAGQIDAAFFVEPFLQQAKRTLGARPLFDTLAGPTAHLGLTGYGATAPFVDANKDAVAAFQRALKRATDEVRADRSKVDPLLMKIAKVDAETAKQTTLTEFVSDLDSARIQPVVDMMVEFKALEQGFDVDDMIVRPQA
ncbi:MAG TPA: ABC transporter substrate-binding protein [Actinophytocola sp.]|uniref:ABC transporter substrate-binding protein n=1 Tax=Actinophytocola sp. TaxID=1872138 RepID=UPI002DBCF2C0|nr:ABC transporter substrate-binding protein [Actinophytocola sp.]HEU5475377.1 ABC transporter substrate-binding protein [Actinophytocola sp.]